MRLRLLLPALVGLLTLGTLAPAQAADPTVSITAQGFSVAGQSVPFRVVVHNGDNNPLVLRIEQAGVPAKNFPVSTTTNEFDDVYRLTLGVNTKVTAILGEVASDSASVLVRPVIGTKVRTRHGTSGRYALLARGAEPLFRSGIAPKIWKGRCLRHEVQRYRSGAWRTVVVTGCRALNSEAQVGWTWRGSHPVGPSFRIRATFAGDQFNNKGPGAWTHFRFR